MKLSSLYSLRLFLLSKITNNNQQQSTTATTTTINNNQQQSTTKQQQPTTINNNNNNNQQQQRLYGVVNSPGRLLVVPVNSWMAPVAHRVAPR